MKSIVILLTFSIIMGSTSCDLFNWKEDQKTELEKLPPPTQSGEYTFGCLVNEKAFVITNALKMTAIYQRGNLQLSGRMENDELDQSMSFNIFDTIIETGDQYDLTNLTVAKSGYSDFSNYPDSYCEFLPQNTLEGVLIIDFFDPNKFIISGTFEYSTAKEDCDTVRITDGRFDLKYIP